MASRTNTANGPRNPRDVSSLGDQEYKCAQTNFDTAYPYAKLDAWAKFPNFQPMLAGQIVNQQALDRIMIGWNGTSVAAQTDLVANPLLQAQHLDNDQLVKRCCAHLVATTGITESAAASYTMHALADIQARHVPAYIDMSHSTSYVVRVVDPRTGNVYQLTASDVLQLAQAHNDAPPDPAHSIHQCGRSAAL